MKEKNRQITLKKMAAAIEAGISGDYEQGMCSPVVIAGILGVAAVLAAIRGRDEAQAHGAAENPKSVGVLGVATGAATSVAFLWALCFYGYPGAAWFFLLAPMVLAGVEVLAVVNMLSEIAKQKQ